jgi:hypothetical protein
MESTKYMVRPICTFCNKDMKFEEGDVLFGEKWFHKDCAIKKPMTWIE